MPAIADWVQQLPEIIDQVRSLSMERVGRGTVEILFGVKPRRAQELLKEFGATGKPFSIDRLVLLEKLYEYGSELSGPEEKQRRINFGRTLSGWIEERKKTPVLLVEAPTKIVNTALDNLPAGTSINFREFAVRDFLTLEEGLRNLVALAHAIASDPEAVRRIVEGSNAA